MSQTPDDLALRIDETVREYVVPCPCGHKGIYRGVNPPPSRVTCNRCGSLLRTRRRRGDPVAEVDVETRTPSRGIPSQERPVRPDITAANQGAISELLICTDLMSRGLHVFRAIGPNCPCDLIVMRGARLTRLEVKTSPAEFRQTARLIAEGRYDLADVVAYVLVTGVAVYSPDLFQETANVSPGPAPVP